MTIIAEISKSEPFADTETKRRIFSFPGAFNDSEFQKWIVPDMAPMVEDRFKHFRLKFNGEIIKTGNIL